MTLTPGVTAVIPTITTRKDMLNRAIKSVLNQDRPVDAISIWADHKHDGAAPTKNNALQGVHTEWVAFLDDDDEWLPKHITTLVSAANATGADVIYPWFYIASEMGFDPLDAFGKEFDADELRNRNYIPTPVLARTKLIQDVGGFAPYGDQIGSTCDDWGLWRKLLDAGATFHHVAERTWVWHWHGANTSGLPYRW